MESDNSNSCSSVLSKTHPQSIKQLHKTGFKGMFLIIMARKVFKKLPFLASLIISIIVVILIFIFQCNRTYVLLDNSAKMVLEIFPNLLGFSFGAFSLIVGFSNSDFLKKGTKLKSHSLYQFLTASFAYALIVQVLVLFLSFIIHWVIRNDMSISLPESFSILINEIYLFLVIFLALYALLLIPYVIINLFTLSQVNHLFLTLENYKERKKNLQ